LRTLFIEDLKSRLTKPRATHQRQLGCVMPGFFNVHGNVWDWTDDCWNESNEGNSGDGSVRLTGDCTWRLPDVGLELQPGRCALCLTLLESSP
jgi:formylglycine-generating enzyme required for sulfatase activity